MRGARGAVLLCLGLASSAFAGLPSDPQPERAEAGRLLAEAGPRLEKGEAAGVATALTEYRSAAAIYARLGDAEGEARALNGEGLCLLSLGRAPEARATLECALPGARQSADRALEAEGLHGLGEALSALGEKRRALLFFARAEALWTQLGDRARLVDNWSSTAIAHDELGEQRIALAYLDEALAVAREIGDRLSEGLTIAGMGKIADDLGDWQRALDFERQALAAARAAGNARGEAVMLNNIGLTYYNLGNLDESAQFLEDALAARRRVGDRRGEARTLTALGRISFDRGDRDGAAARYATALELSRAAGDRTGEATAHSRRSDLFEAEGRKAEARVEQAEALRIRQGLGDARAQVWSLMRLGTLDAALGETGRAFEEFGAALELSRSLGDVTGEVDVSLARARVESDLGRLADASADVTRALEGVEALRTHVASPALRAAYLAKVQAAYRLDVDVKMRRQAAEPDRGFDRQAFEAAERMRARSLLDLLSAAGTRIREGVDAGLLARSRDLQLLVNAKLERLLLLPRGKAPEARAALERELGELTAELEDVETRIRVSSPRYAELSEPRPLGLDEVRRQVLDDETLLLEFALGEERSHVFVVGTSTLVARDLPGRAAIEETARRLLDAVKQRNESPAGERPAERSARRARAAADFDAAAADLGRQLFGEAPLALGARRLVVVPDGVLQFVPFAALPVRPSASGSARLLAEDHEIATLPSASVLPLMRRDRQQRSRPVKTLAVLADPVFSADDERVAVPRGDRRRDEPGTPDVAGPARAAASERLPRLPFTRREAAAIARLVPPASREEAFDFDASRATATRPDLANYRFVHFATHGFLDAGHPELSGIVLSLVDRSGREQPGFLSAVDAYNLKLDADLVALSGCQTALGREVAGEGLLGLARGFVYAGATRVLASLWKVDDAATADLMGKLYEGILGPAKLAPAAALRAAQLSLRDEERFHSPVDWAAFVLMGEWR